LLVGEQFPAGGTEQTGRSRTGRWEAVNRSEDDCKTVEDNQRGLTVSFE